MRLADRVTTPMFLSNELSGRPKPKPLLARDLKLSDISEAYDIVGEAAKEKALNVILRTAGAKRVSPKNSRA
ncbi:MAG: hypothetical protein ABJC13_00580 [Acidobacteriota bacterium]